jgi:Ca2+-dependent lipid-binding protein
VQVSLVEMPEFSFAITLYGGNLMMVPGLEAFLRYFIREVLLRPYVLPEAVTIPLVGS